MFDPSRWEIQSDNLWFRQTLTEKWMREKNFFLSEGCSHEIFKDEKNQTRYTNLSWFEKSWIFRLEYFKIRGSTLNYELIRRAKAVGLVSINWFSQQLTKFALCQGEGKRYDGRSGEMGIRRYDIGRRRDFWGLKHGEAERARTCHRSHLSLLRFDAPHLLSYLIENSWNFE